MNKSKTTKEWMEVKSHSKYNPTTMDTHRKLASGAIVADVVSINGQSIVK
jgi:hypothetical protein